MNDSVKPPTQKVDVSGFKADLYGNKEIRWNVLIQLPKFQMFIIERSKKSYETVMDWIVDYIKSQIRDDESIFFDEYVNWHDQKGYWKNETIYGELVEIK
ncbi:hypothetical protein [Acinetobacter modestus]|uniref:hypothetical protein n=1 Tax=Acinetobacter modestus TaxID=1776740 RepID=UPI003017B410